METEPLENSFQKETSTPREVPILTSDTSNKPRDRFNLVYIAFLYEGMAILFPYNAFIFLLDFYQERFCDLRLFYWSMVAVTISANALFCLITNLIADYVSPSKRILTGHLLYLLSLVVFLIFSSLAAEGVFDSLPNSIGYTPLLAGFITGAGIGVAQPSYYAISSHLPRRFTQALIVGETISGMTSACFRIVTKLMKPPGSCVYYDTLIYISLTLVVMLISVVVWGFIYFNKYTNYFFDQLKGEKFCVEYRALDQEEEQLDSSVVQPPVCVLANEKTLFFIIKRDKLANVFAAVKESLGRKFIIFKKTCSLQLTIFINFVITLFLFPTFITAAYKCHTTLCDWIPIIALTVFVITDFIIRWFTLIRVRCSDFVLLLISLSRALLIPLIFLFIVPLDHPIIHVDYGLPIFLIVVALFGFSNGYFGNVPLVIIPTKLKGRDKQLGISMGIFMLVSALVVGTLLALPFNEIVLYKSSNVTTSICCLRNTSILLNTTASDGVCTC